MPPRLAALFDTPSSPAGPSPHRNGATTTPAGSPSGRQSSSLPTTPSNSSRQANSSPYSSARSNRLLGRTPGATYVVSKKLDNKIDIHIFHTMMSLTLAFYVKKAGGDSPCGVMKSLIQEQSGTWGITYDAMEDKASWGVVVTRVRTHLTDRRYDIKKVLTDSIWVSVKTEDGAAVIENREDPLDIIKLCESLVGLVPDASLKVTLPMLGCVALLRQILVDVNGGPKFWEKVDEQLVMIRSKYEEDEAWISKAIGKVLKNDCRTYGSPDLSVFT
ncbi:hypothetical protein C8R43DRAFT_1132781 [Mycena crocata]|nr:hypothetical protein C8R43DRAFT_1132781 [Mycena crocata]